MSLPGRVRGKQTFVDLAFGAESHVKRHLVHLAAARERILSYMERGDLQSIEDAASGVSRSCNESRATPPRRGLRHQVVFRLFLSERTAVSSTFCAITGPRSATSPECATPGELGHPFHVVDGRSSCCRSIIPSSTEDGSRRS